MFPIKPADAASAALSSAAGHGNDSNAFVNTLAKVNRRLNPTPREITEARYLGLFQLIDLSKDFFYSYTYDLTNSLQHNMTAATSKTFPPPPFKDMYAWNFHQTRELEAQVGHLNSSFWVMPIVHGAFLQRKCNLLGRVLNVTLIARRSRHFAGTRYLKRGVSDGGIVANDVEVEQIAHAEEIKEGLFSSFVQMRGSIPTFWTQDTSKYTPKPDIVISRVDPMYSATQAHFADLLERYGSPLLVLDLVKHTEKRERESIVGQDYRSAIEHVNSTMPQDHSIRYCALDFSVLSKHRHMNVLKELEEVAAWTVGQVGFFCSAPRRTLKQLPFEHGITGAGEVRSLKRPRSQTQRSTGKSQEESEPFSSVPGGHIPVENVREDDPSGSNKVMDNTTPRLSAGDVSTLLPPPWGQGFAVMPMEQQGVLRTNCIDCLDRTNVGQFSVGVHALAKQLYVMGVSSQESLDSGSQVVQVLMELYTELGDSIAWQYGGSEAHKKNLGSSGPGKQVGSMNKQREFLISIKRYYSNAFTDRAKQDAMNIFLGYFVPTSNGTQLWDLDTDYFLHNTHVENSGLQSMREYKKNQYFLDQDEEPAESDETGGGSSSAATTLSGMIDEDRIAEIQLKRRRVRRMSERQLAATSQWWRDSLQRYAQRRMWMHLGPPKQGQLPERFVRIHEPHRLTVFDDWFDHEFAKPVLPRKEAAVHNAKPSRAGKPSVGERRSSRAVQKSAGTDGSGREKGVTVVRYVQEISHKARSMLGRPQAEASRATRRPATFNHASQQPDARQDHIWAAGDVAYIGSTTPEERIETDLTSYTSFANDLLLLVDSASEASKAEPSSYLADFNIATDTAAGALSVQKLAEEHHCGATIACTPYEGLRKEISARRVASAVVLHVQQLGWAAQRDLNLEEEWQLIRHLMQDAGINVDGVVNQIVDQLDHEEQEKARLEEILRKEALEAMSSPLTTIESMDLYCSFFEKDGATGSKSLEELRPSRGEYIGSPAGRRSTGEVHETNVHTSSSKHFEMIERDLFVSRENQYMLFNEVGKNHALRILRAK
ncbi:unnamed protein product [Sphacelaria rigidula]